MSDQTAYVCSRCQIGHLRPGLYPFTRVYNGMLVSIPDMPSFTCDVCGFVEYDASSLAGLETLVGKLRRAGNGARAASKSAASHGSRRRSLKP